MPSSTKRKKIFDRAAKTALRGSYAIWFSRNSITFQKMTLIPMPDINSEGSETAVATQNYFYFCYPFRPGLKPRDL